MKYISTRCIDGNRGDLLSRYGILSALRKLVSKDDILVMALKPEHIKPLDYQIMPYGKLYNSILPFQAFRQLVKSNVVIWTGGLDLSDDSSLLKLLYVLFNFTFYKILGLKIFALNQGAGPIKTIPGKLLVKCILKLTDTFIARDMATLTLLKGLNPGGNFILGYDGIFGGDFTVTPSTHPAFSKLLAKENNQLVIGFNVRQWFHFNYDFLPNYLKSKKSGQAKDLKMEEFINSSVKAIAEIRKKLNAKIVLVSAYEYEVCPEDDEINYLIKIKDAFKNDEDVMLFNYPLTLQEYLYLISQLDIMVGTRLHSTLTALRLGIPSINLNYTLKGRDIYKDMGFSEFIIELPDFIKQPSLLMDKINYTLGRSDIKTVVKESVAKAIEQNFSIYEKVFNTKRHVDI